MSFIRSGARKYRNEGGMTAIFVTMIMIFVISILVIGFALLSQREQRQSLDTQLSAQAYYAAESGVNDAIAAIRAQQSAPSGTITPKGGCADSGPYKFNTSVPKSSELSAPDKVSYSCVIIDPAPKQLDFKNVGSDGVVVPLISDRGGANPKFQSITLTWQPIAGREANATTGCTVNTTLPPNTPASWTCGFPMLRVETVPTETFSRAALLSGTRVKFLKPVAGGGGNAIPINNNATVDMVRCTNVCTMRLDVGGASSKYYMRVTALYGQTPRVSVAATDAAGAVGLSGAQATIDVTGKAQGVMRRVVVAVDLTDANASKAPNAAITSGESICKRFAVGPNYFTNTNLDTTTTNPLCRAQNFLTDAGGAGGINAGVGGWCDVHYCAPVSPGGGFDDPDDWNPFIVNLSDNAASDISGCRWDMGDGAIITNQHCYYKDSFQYVYPSTSATQTSPDKYIVVLTMYLKDGSVKTANYIMRVPF